MKNIFFVFAFVFIVCSSCSPRQNDLKWNAYNVLKEYPYDSANSGMVLQPGDSLTFQANFIKYNDPVQRSLRISGGSIYPAPFQHRNEETFRKFLFLIDDCLDSTDTFKQRYSLYFKGENDTFERNAYFRLSKKYFSSGSNAVVSFAVKTDRLQYNGNEGLALELQFYHQKPGIHPDDLFDKADKVIHIKIPEGTFNWKMISETIMIPANTACILLRMGGKGFAGVCKMEAPRIIQKGHPVSIASFAKYDEKSTNWVGENLSTKEWPEFEFSANGKVFYSGKIFDRASDISDFIIDLPQGISGKQAMKIKLKEHKPSSFAFRILDIGLGESSARGFEVAYVPEFVFQGKEFSLLIETHKPAMDLQFGVSGNIHPVKEQMHLEEPGLYAVPFVADSLATDVAILISSNGRKAEVSVRQVLSKQEDSVMLCCTDDIYIYRNKKEFSAYLQWYLRQGIGNAYGFRPSYQWSGSHNADSSFYRWAVSLLQQLSMPYSLMVEGRCLPEKDLNPDDAFLASSFYKGRQAHENDGGFYYWRHFKYNGLFSDLFAKMRPSGGIFAKTRPVHTNNGTHVFFDPDACSNMQEGSAMFVQNLKNAKGPSTRHTGPTTMFRYMFQAGYNWLGAEQMYGPEEVILSSLRGACKAYGKINSGTHLATQWGSGPFDAPEHANRLFLSLAVSYMHGINHINTEDGLWTTEDNHHRYTREGKEHAAEQKKMLDYIFTHQRRGSFIAPLAILQGRNDAWRCFGRNGSAWAHSGEEWKYGPAEYSFDLLHVFYPNSKLDAVYKFPCPREKQGWYTGFPYGPVDLTPIETPETILKSYKAIAFLGWNTFHEEDFEKILFYVKNGGIVLLARPHLNAELRHGIPARLPQSKAAAELLGKNYTALTGIVRRNVGKGKVIYFASNVYPVDSTIRKEYEKELVSLGEMMIAKERVKGWIRGTDVVGFTAYQWPDEKHRTLYILNTDWWSNDSIHNATLLLGNKEFEIASRRGKMETITICDNIAIMPLSMQTDVMEIRHQGNVISVKIQTTEPDKLIVYKSDGTKKEIVVKKAGVQFLEI